MRDTEVSGSTAKTTVNQTTAGRGTQEPQKATEVYTSQGKSTHISNGVGKTYETSKYDKADEALLDKIKIYNQYAELRSLNKEQSSVTKKAPSIQTSSGLGKNTIMNNESMVYFDRLSSTKTGNGNSIINVIKLGDSGTDVYEVQRKLQALDMLQGGYVQGQFDESTLNALNRFKNEYGSSSNQDKKEGVLNQNTKSQIDQKIKEQASKSSALVEGHQKQRAVEYYEKNERVHTKEELEKIKIDIARMDTMKEIARVAGQGRVAQIESNGRFADETLKASPEMLRVSPYTGVLISATELIEDKNIFTNEKLTEEERFGAKANLVLSAIGAGALSKSAKPVLSSAKGMVGNLTSKIDDVIKAVQKVDDVKINTVNSIPNGTVKPEAVKDVVKAVEGGIDDVNLKINIGQQNKHIPGTNNYKQELANGKLKSILSADPQQLIDDFAGTGQKIGTNKERVDFGNVIGKYVNPETGEAVDTTVGIIHYGKNGAHIVPARPK